MRHAAPDHRKLSREAHNMKTNLRNFFSRLNRANRILAAVLVVQLVVALVAFLPRSTSASDQAGGPLLNGFKPDDVSEITIHDKDNNEIVLARNAGNWVLPR